MLTIHDISVLDNWKSTKSCGLAGGEILRILRKNNIDSEFDIQYFYDSEDNIKEVKFIIEGVPHNSQAEENIMKVIFSEIDPICLPELWSDRDFVRIDREQAVKELSCIYVKIDEYREYLKIPLSDRPYKGDLIRKHPFFNYVSQVRGITLGLTPKRFYKSPAAQHAKDEKGVSRIVSHLPEGEYTVYHILEDNMSELVCSEEIWAKSENELFNAIDARRGKLFEESHAS